MVIGAQPRLIISWKLPASSGLLKSGPGFGGNVLGPALPPLRSQNAPLWRSLVGNRQVRFSSLWAAIPEPERYGGGRDL